MKRLSGLLCALFVLLPVVTGCSKPESHVSRLDLTNDLGVQVKLEMCKDDVHCSAISDLWVPTLIDPNQTLTFSVSNEETTVFRLSFEANEKLAERCLRVRFVKPHKDDYQLSLSSATAC